MSLDPRIFAVAIQADAHTRNNIDNTGAFSVSMLGESTKDLSLKSTRKSTSGDCRLEGDPVAWIECRVVGKAKPGEHVVYFGEVVGGKNNGDTTTTLRDVGMPYSG